MKIGRALRGRGLLLRAGMPSLAYVLRGGRVPTLPITLYLSVGDQLRHHAIEIVRLDLESLGNLGDGDPGLSADEFQCLGGPSSTTAPATGASRLPSAAAAGRRASA